MRLNESPNQSLTLREIFLERVLIPQVSDTEKKLTESLRNVEKQMGSESSLLMSILGYSFVFRYLSNNQPIILLGLLDLKKPMNLHISTQALSNGMKPVTEAYG